MSWESPTEVYFFDPDSTRSMTPFEAYRAFEGDFMRIESLPDYDRHYYDKDWSLDEKRRREVEEIYTGKEPYTRKLALYMRDKAIYFGLAGHDNIKNRELTGYLVRFFHLRGDASYDQIQHSCLEYVKYLANLRTIIEIDQDMPDDIANPARLKALRERWHNEGDIGDMPDDPPPYDGMFA